MQADAGFDPSTPWMATNTSPDIARGAAQLLAFERKFRLNEEYAVKRILALASVCAVGAVGVVASPVLGQYRTANKSNGTSATAVYVRPPGTCNPIGSLEINYIPSDFEVVVKSSGDVENMTFKVFDNGDEVASGDLDVISTSCGSNGVYTLARADCELNGYEDPEDGDDDNAIVNSNDGSLTLTVYFPNGKKFGSSSFRVPS